MRLRCHRVAPCPSQGELMISLPVHPGHLSSCAGQEWGEHVADSERTDAQIAAQ